MTADAVKARLLEAVDLAALSVCVKGVRAVPGGVLVETREEKDLDFFRGNAGLREAGLVVTAPEEPRRRIIAFGVPRGMNEGAVLSAFCLQNRPEMGEEVFGSCIKVEAERCFRFLGFGHATGSCAKRARTVARCAGDGHSALDCPNREATPCCVSCRTAGLTPRHGCFSGACPLLKGAFAQQLAWFVGGALARPWWRLFRVVLLSSVYCRHGEPLDGYLQYFEWVFTQPPGVPL